MIPFVDLKRLHDRYSVEFSDALSNAVVSSQFVGGESVDSFEPDLARYLGVKHVVTVNSGTAALQLALLAKGIGPGDEVIIPASSFFATLEAVIHTGAEPVLVDVDESALIDLSLVESALSSRTRAIVPVHLYGQPVDIPRLRSLCANMDVMILEDAAQAIGGRIPTVTGGMVGALGDAAAFSFYPTKNLGALGDGGAVATNDDQLATQVRLLRAHGDASKNEHQMFGFTERMHAIQAEFLSIKLRDLDVVNESRRSVAVDILQVIDALGLERPALIPSRTHAWHLMTIWHRNRNALANALRAQGVATAIHYPTALHETAAYRQRFGPASHPRAERIAKETLSLPLFPFMRGSEVERLGEALSLSLELVSRG